MARKKHNYYSPKKWKPHRHGPNWTEDHALILINNRTITPRTDLHRTQLVGDLSKGMNFWFGDDHRVDKLMVIDGTAVGYKIAKASYEGNWDSCNTDVWAFIVGCLKLQVRYSCHYTAVSVGDMMRVKREREACVKGMNGMSVHLAMDEQERFFVCLCYNAESTQGGRTNNPALVFWK